MARPTGDRRVSPLSLILVLLVVPAGLTSVVYQRARTVSFPEICAGYAGVYGDVPLQGLFCPGPGMTAGELVRMAGGGPCAYITEIVKPGTKLTVRKSGGRCLVETTGFTGAETLGLGMKIDVNSAAAGDLEALPGIGPALAERMILYRLSNGPFRDAESLLQVRGIGPAAVDRISGLIDFHGATGR